MTRRRPKEVMIREIAALQHGVISLWQLRAAGLADSTIVSRCRSGTLVRVLRAVYGFQPGISDAGLAFAGLLGVGADRIYAASPLLLPSLDEVLLLDPRYRVSHWTTLHLAGVIDYAPAAVDVTVIGARRGSRLPGVRGHRRLRMDPAEHTTIMGVPSVTVARALLEVAAEVAPRRLRRLLREAQFRKVLDPAEMVAALRATPTHPGTRCLRRADPELAVTLLGDGPVGGDLARFIAQELQVGPWIPQLELRTPDGGSRIVDFGCRHLRLALEGDGADGHDTTQGRLRDADRDAELAAMGWLTVRATAAQLADPRRLGQQVHAIARDRGWDGRPVVDRFADA